jgi:CDP-paratose 2-epimerase
MAHAATVFCNISRMAKTLLVTGSSGLIGSEVCVHFATLGYTIHGVDNNQRAVFFGPQGDTRWNQQRLAKELKGFVHHELDIRDRAGVLALIRDIRPSVIVHTAAQPSHDRAAAIPFDDFDTNAVGTLNLLEAARQALPESPFVHMSTNKVYGDAPNSIKLVELPTRWDYADPAYEHGIPETFTIDQSKHSLFGASKVAADVMVQEYGRYFNMPTCALRGGCLTGPNHSGVELHGFLSYLVKCNLEGREYKVFGYKGKQVRDNIHSLDVARFMAAYVESPAPARFTIWAEARPTARPSSKPSRSQRNSLARNRSSPTWTRTASGDHICYYSDLRKMRAHYPSWDITQSLEETIRQIVEAWQRRPKA